MGQQKNHGDYSLREWSSLFANPLASKLADVFKKKPPSQQSGRAPLFFWIPTLGNFFISRKARKAGPRAKRVSDVFSQSRASSQMSLKKPAIPAIRACPALFLNANSWQFLHLAQGAKSRAAREASERCVFKIPCKLDCEGI